MKYKRYILGKLKEDFLRTYNYTSGNKLKRVVETLLAPGVRTMIVFRFGQWSGKQHKVVRLILLPIYFILNQRVKWKFGIQIPRSTSIDGGFFIGHFGGINISTKAKIGKNVNISQQVTIGESGKGENYGAPTIGDNVYIGAGAKVIGKIHVGNNAKIGANAVVYKDIEENAVVVSYPGYKVISHKGNRQIKD